MPRKSPVAGRAGAVRIMRLSGVALAAAEAHGKRLDRNGKARAIQDAAPISTTGLDLAELYGWHVEGCHIAKSGTKALHMVFQFPTALMSGDEAGTMLDHARVFATETFGEAAIFADRVDRDEKSRHVVDLFLAPRYEKRTKRGSKEAVSTSRHLKALAEKHGKAPTLRGQGQALQDAWHAYMRDRIGLDVERGAAKVLPGDDWQTPEQLEGERLAEEAASLESSLYLSRERGRIAAEIAERLEHEQHAAEKQVREWTQKVEEKKEELAAIERLLKPLRASLAVYDDFLARQAERLRPLARHWQAALDAVRAVLTPSRIPSPQEIVSRSIALVLAHPVSASFAGRQWSPDPRENWRALETMDSKAEERVRDALDTPPDDWPGLHFFGEPMFREEFDEARAGDDGITWKPERIAERPFRRHRAFVSEIIQALATAMREADKTPESMPPEAEAAAAMPEPLRQALRDTKPSEPGSGGR